MMYYFDIFYFYFFKLKLFIPVYLILLILILTVLNIYFFQKQGELITFKRAKIKNFTITWILASFYIIFYFFIFIILRLLQIGHNVDLEAIIVNYSKSLVKNYLFTNVIIFFSLLLIILIWFFVFIIIKNFLGFKLWQLYIYYSRIYSCDKNNKLYKISKKFSDICLRFLIRYTFKNVIVKIWIDYLHLPLREISRERINKIAKILGIIIIIIIIILDLVFNKSLFYIYYFLPVYLILSIWIKISNILGDYHFMTETGEFAAIMYGSTTIFVNVIKEEELYLQICMTDPKKIPVSNEHWIYSSRCYNAVSPITYFREYCFNQETNMYDSLCTDNCFDLKDLKEVDGRFFVEDPKDVKANDYYEELIKKRLFNEKDKK
jgi:hypothetical protein